MTSELYDDYQVCSGDMWFGSSQLNKKEENSEGEKRKYRLIRLICTWSSPVILCAYINEICIATHITSYGTNVKIIMWVCMKHWFVLIYINIIERFHIKSDLQWMGQKFCSFLLHSLFLRCL